MSWTTDEMMSVAAARALPDGASCFVGIGLPSKAANLARRTHAPGLVLIYEAGAIGAKPSRLPMSIGDGILAETADAVVSVPEVFNYWLQPGRIEVGFLGAAQIDRFANINTTVIGPDYDNPKVRLPGAGGAPEIAASCGEVVVIVRQTPRSFVEKVDFVTSVGYGSGPGDRERLGLRGRGPVRVITDLGVLEPDPETCELTLTAVHPGVDAEQARAETGWELAVADDAADLARADRRGARGAARARGLGGAGVSGEAFILDAVRTPFGRAGGALAGVRPDDLAAHAVRALLGARARTSTPRASTTSCSATPTPRARTTATSGGWRCCWPGCRRACRPRPSTASAARASTPRCRRSRAIETGDASLMLVGGVESMSRAPWVLLKPERAYPRGHETLHSTTLGWRMVNPEMPEEWTISLGESTEKVAGIYGISREAQDEFAVRSHRLAAAAWDGGFYDPWVVPVPVRDGEHARDEGIRPDALGRGAGRSSSPRSRRTAP